MFFKTHKLLFFTPIIGGIWIIKCILREKYIDIKIVTAVAFLYYEYI